MNEFETFLKTVAASAWPRPMQSDREGYMRYCWVATFPQGIEESLEALEEVVGAASEYGMEQAELDAGVASGGTRPRVKLRAIDSCHLLICVDVPTDERLNSWLVASTWALRALNEQRPIADLQGLPLRYWLILSE